ncbi:hypothetical protein TSAR_007716 [Trichomalopsis sarcophagae]|uniref:Microtubule-associated protein futsch n=1 Tax=Trichomalopsis sarcophagae TaxID=543379 RepID=A0A232EYR2_9HYME|nr:hypothetical protein TSAR_007716 [Trichomalopsis sarcophagae]
MTTMAPAGEGGGGGSGTATTTTTTSEQAPATSTTTTSTSAPSQHPPPSPLSGCYLLVVLPEPHTAQHKDLILNRLAKGFLSWDKDSCHVDLEKELQALVAQSPEGEEARNGERLIQYATENLVTEVLIYPQSNTLLQCIRNLLASFTKHRHIIHAGYTFGGNGSWILQDGTFSLADFLDAFSEHEVQRVLRAYENSVTVDIHCAGVGDWTTARLSKEACTRACRVRVNPDDVLTAGVPAITSFTSYIGQYLVAQTLDQLMEPSDVVGNIRFSHPTLYVFPGGQGDAALFGINGFNMLVDGGFARKACFWDFTRHLDRLDAVLVTRINNSNVGGMSSVLKKKKEMHVYPQIGHFFCNLVERRHSNSPDGDKDIDPLILNLIDIGQEMMVNLRHINLRPHPCYRDPEPINLYHKVGHGTLDMYVLSPSKDSREVREFLAKWNASDSKLFAGSHRKDSTGMVFPAQNLVSICALLVWQPANPEDTITRILFPGSTPQHKIFEGFERLKHLEFLKHPTCTAKSLSPSTSLMALKDKAAILKPKLSSIERETKRLAETRREKRDASEIKAVKKDAVDDASTRISSTAKPSATPQIKTETKAKKVVENKKIESEAKESKKIEKELKETKKDVKKVEKSEQPESDAKKTDAVKVETEKTAPPTKEPKTQKIDVKKRETKEITKTTVKPSKPESMTKPSMKPVEKKPKPPGEKKDIMKPSPTTPKKSMNGAATKTEVSKTVAKSAVRTSSKISTAAPAKSAKDANNRMVVEQKNIESAAASAATKAPTKPKAIERKPISRRTKPVSPSKARLPISPAKSTRSTPTASVKSEKDAVIRKVKGGTTDSSAVSTPSGIEPESAIKLIDKNLTEKSEDISLDSIESKVLADLKEEREVVEEIEAVLQKAERIEEARKEERFEGDDEITAEATDKKEEDMTEEDVTAEMDDAPKKLSRKESQELTEEDEYLIVEKEEIYTEDSVQSGDAEQKHHLDEAESEKSKIKIGKEPEEEEEEAEEEDQEEEKEDAEEKKDEVPEKSLVATATEGNKRKSMDLSPEHKELLKEEMKQIIASATEAVQKTEEKDDSGKKDSEDITKDPSSLSPDKLDSSVKPDIDQKEAQPEKLEESQERISTLESGATTTAPTMPEDERIALDEIKEDVDEKHVLEEVKEKEIPVKEKEVIPEALPAVSKPEVKVLDVKPPVHHGIARDVVKTPDEVADLPVHEEVDPKLYRMEELEKEKETKAPVPVQESKEPAPMVAPAKEQKDKGMFSFFGKVADKFEKGIDKLTKKARRDSADKDAEDRSSKSSSPKESKPQEKVIFEDVDIDKVFPKVEKHQEKVESFEQVQPQVSDIRVAAIKETAAFLQEEIKSVAVAEPSSDITDKTKDEKLEVQLEDKIVEDIEEVEALVEEASMKFKNVKDSLQDSLESLEDKADGAKKSAVASADMVKDTLIEAAEKLDDIKSDISDLIESKEPEKVKFIIPSSDDTEKDEDDSDGVVRDFKEAVRDVAEVLMGTSGIEIEKEKPKDVEQIVKKVAEVLKEDDFLVEKSLLTDKVKEKDEGPKSPAEEAMIPTKVGVTEEFAPHEEVEDIPEVGVSKRLSTDYQKADKFEVHEEPCTKVHKDKEVSLTSPARDTATDKTDAMRICEDLLRDDVLVKPIAEVESESRADVMDLGLEEVCVKKVAKREVHEEQSADEKVIVESEIGFEQKLSPGKAELVTVTPGSTPTSPKLATELELPELPTEYKNIFNKETSLENLIEEFIVVKKHKITIQVIEYIVIVKRVPKEKVINIIQKTIVKHKIPRDSVADSVQVLRTHDIPSEKRLAIENYITNEYLNKNKRITFSVIEEISMKETIPKSVVIEIVEEIVDKQISRESVFDIPEETYFTILREIDDTTQVSTGIEEKDDDKIVEGFVNISSKGAAESFMQEVGKKSHDEEKVDDFVSVEAEHKIPDVSSTSPTDKPDAQKTKDVDEVTEHVSEVIEADEKFVKDTPEKSMKEVSESDSKYISSAKVEQMQDREISEVSEVDTNEKYLDEAKEKTTEKKDFEMPIETLKETHIDNLEKSHADATGRSGGFVDVTEIEQTKDDDQSQDADKDSHDGIVKRMVVTASSEDGGHEIEICPSGTITFTKSPTPEDSLREVDVKSTPEKDSLILDKDSLRSAGSTPEKDSIVSDKPDQEDDKITPEDSLEKSEIIVDILQSKDIKTDKTTLKELETALAAQKSVGVVDQSSSIITSTEIAKTPDSLHSGDASPAESVFSKSPTEKAFTQATELFSHENLITEKIIDDLSVIADKSKSPSVEKERATDVSHSEAGAKSKSPSLEKEIEKKDVSVDASTEVKIGDKSKSPSAEKEVAQKEMPPDALKDVKVADRSKSPSSEKELEKKDTKPEVLAEVKVDDRSKSPSVEKETADKEISPELQADIKTDDRSKSPSLEKEVSKKESSQEPDDVKIDAKSKSPSVEKEAAGKEISPELQAEIRTDERSKSPSLEKEVSKKETFAQEPDDVKTAEISKSPSVEKEAADKEILPELQADIKTDDRSKSPSLEKEVSKKETSQEPDDVKTAEKSKSPSVEKDTIQDKKPEMVDRSKSPSLEKETEVKIASEVVDDAKIHDKSRSSSAEKEVVHKEMSPDLKTDVKSDDKSKLPSFETVAKKETSPMIEAEAKTDARSKSPSVEKDTDKQEVLSEVTADAKLDDRSKSPSMEKELAQKELPSALDVKTEDRSKSPSVEKEKDKKESSPALDVKADKSKSPSVEKETDKEISSEAAPDFKANDRSKSPSVEKETDIKQTLLEIAASTKEEVDPTKSRSTESGDLEKEKSPEVCTHDKTIEKSKSPSPEQEIVTKEILPSSRKDADKREPSPEAITKVDIKDRSKSPSVEKEEAQKETSQELSTDGKVDRSKSPSVEKDFSKKEMSPEAFIETDVKVRSKSPSLEKEETKKEALIEAATDGTIVDRSKSPSAEKDAPVEDILSELVKDSKTDDRSKSPSIEKDVITKETSPEVAVVDKAPGKSKLPSPDKEVAKKEMTPELLVDDKDDSKSKSPSFEKDSSKKEESPEPTVDNETRDRSKSPSIEKEAGKKEASPVLISEADTRPKSPSVESESDKKEMSSNLTAKAADRSKSPSVEKDHIKKEISSEVAEEIKSVDKSKSTSPEKDDAIKEMSPKLDAGIKAEDRSKSTELSAEQVTDEKETSPDLQTDDRSKPPCVEKEADKKDALTEVPTDAKRHDGSKSPSVEKDAKKEMSPELVADAKGVDRSRSPSAEKDTDKKDILSKVTEDVKSDDRSKSPSVEKDSIQKEISPELVTDSKAEDRSIAPSIEKDADKEYVTSEIVADVKAGDESKSPSVEKDTDKKAILSEVTGDAKADDRSKSPSIEKDSDKKEVLSEAIGTDRSKSPSVEKEALKKEMSPELAIEAKAEDRSKSPSVEKDADKKDISSDIIAEVKFDDKSKSPSVEKDAVSKELSPELVVDAKGADRSKSPSVEKDTDKKDVLSEVTADAKVDARSKSPSIEKDAVKKEMSPELVADSKAEDRSKSPSVEKDADKKDVTLEIVTDVKAGVKPKSPSVQKDTDKKDILSEVTGDAKAEDRSKSPSVEKDADKKDVTSEIVADVKAGDKSKSPSVEKDTDEKDILPEITADTKADDRSKSPSVDKDSIKKEISPELAADAKSDDKSKSPSLEKDSDKKDVLSEKAADAKSADRSKSPSVEKDTDKKDLSSAVTLDTKADEKSKSPSVEKDVEKKDITNITADEKADDRSKSPSVDKDSPKKEISPEFVVDMKADDKAKSSHEEKDLDKRDISSEVTADAKTDDRSKSLSVETETDKKESSPVLTSETKADDRSKSPSVEKDDKQDASPSLTSDTKIDDESKSPSVEKETEKKEMSAELGTDAKVDERSKSPSVEKDADKKVISESSADIKTGEQTKSPSPEIQDSKDDVKLDRSKSPSAEKDSDKTIGVDGSVSIVKSKSPSIEKDTSKTELLTAAAADVKSDDRSKSPSLEKEKIESRSSIVEDKIDDFFDKKASLSLEGDKLAEKEPAVQQVSISEDKAQKSRSPSVSGDLKSEALDFNKSKSVSPISEKTRADISLLDTADERKSSIASIESHAEEKGKDRSRSHSLFDTGDKTPLVRSRAASLYEDKIVDKLGVLEHAKDPLGHAHDVFEETDELRLSQEAIDKLHAPDSKEDSAHKQDVTPEIRKAIEDYIFSEYVSKKKLITTSTIYEISVIYNIDQHIIMRIINEIISHQRIKRETIVDYDDTEHEETNQKLLDDEEKLTNYINDEFISKKKKIDSKTVDTIASVKSVSRHLVILVIENIISSRSLRRESIVDGDFTESHDSSQKEDSHTSTNIVFDKDSSSRKESLSESLKPSVEAKSMSPSPEPSLTYKLGRPDPHIDEEITISENKRIEVESLLIDEYITRGIKITETILEQIVTKTSLPKYIIIEIIEEILIKKHLSKDAIADKSIFHDDDDDSQHKLEYEGMATPEIGERKSSGYSTPDTRNYEVGLEKGGQYADYESPFHKAFMGGMTEIRTTHITTLSGKSTPDFGQRTETPESISETTDNAKTTITSVPGQFESTTGDDSHPTSSASQSKTEETVQESVKTTEETHSQLPTGETVVVLKTTQITTYPEEITNITKEFITRESMSDEDPAKKQMVEQEESETITKVIKHEVVHMTGEPVITKRTSISGGDFNQEFITRETTKTITSQEDIDPVSLFDTFGTTGARRSVDDTETSLAFDGKAADMPSTISPSAVNLEEKLISLDSHPSDTSKTPTSSMSGHDSKADSSFVHEEKHTTFFSKDLMDHTIPEQLEQSAFPLIRDLITDDKSYSGKSSPDVSLPKDIVYGGSTGKSTPDVSMSPLMRDGSMMQSHLQSGRSTPDKRSDRGSRTATPEGFRSGDVIRTIITTTRTMSDDGEIITTTQEVTEATNEKGETIVITEKTDVKVDERLPETKPIDIQRAPSASSDKDFDPTSPRSDLSSGHSRAATHMWGSSDERHTYSDEEQSSPPFSSSPYHQDSSVKEGTFKTPDDFASAAMSSSFYGELPEESIHFHTSTLSKTVQQVLPEGEPDEFSFKKFTVEKEFAGGHSDKGSKKYVDEADLDFEKALTEEKGEHDRGQASSVLGAAGDFSQELEKSSDQSKAHPADDKNDPLAGWGSPLGLPSPKAPRKFNLRSPIQPCSSADLSPDSLNFDVINDWGEPMRLPSPAPTQANEVSNKGSPGTPKKEKKQQAKKVLSENIKNKKRSESPSKNEKRAKDSKNKVQPVYVDLTYVSHHGNSFYTALEFFKKVRARYYVFSGTEPSREVYDALLEAKKTWEDKDLEVTMIPTYDTDTLGYWVADNEEALAAHHIDLSPSASRCTINLQDHETSCSAYRLEF